MPYSGYTTEEVGHRGQALYEERIRDNVEAEHAGKYLVLDITTGDYEVDADDLPASDRLLSRKPKAVLYGLRIGHRTAYRLGAGLLSAIPSPEASQP